MSEIGNSETASLASFDYIRSLPTNWNVQRNGAFHGQVLIARPAMSTEISKCFLVQFTKHVTYEMELQATSEKDALELACEMIAGVKQTGFVPVETDHTDLTAISLEPASLNLPSKIPAAMASSSRAVSSARPVTSSDVAVIVKLLEEVRDTTLSHGSWDDAKRLIRQFTE